MSVCLFCTLTPDSVLIRPYNIMQTYIWWFYFVFFVHKNEFVLIKMTNSKVSNWEILRISLQEICSNARDLFKCKRSGWKIFAHAWLYI